MWARYTLAQFGNEIESTDLGNCSTLALNIGQWPVAYRAGSRPWSIARYRRTVENMLDTIFRKAPHLKGSIAWVSTQPTALVRGLHGQGLAKPPRDWRTDPFIQQQNSATRAMTARYNMKYIDTYHVIYPLSDMAYDSSHYIGTPGMWAAALTLNELCS